jgi:DNA-binding transcriptional ArsR family regulator
MRRIIGHRFNRTFVITDGGLSKALRSESGTRRKILDMLYERGEMSPSDIARALGISKPTVAYHLRAMWKRNELKLSRTERIGNLIEKYYSPTAVKLEIPLPNVGDVRIGGKYAGLFEDVENSLHELFLALARNYKEELPKGDMMKLTDTLIGLMLYVLIADGRDLIIYNNRGWYWDDKAGYLSTKKIDEDFGHKNRRNSIFLKVYDGMKNATETWKEENKGKLGEDIQLIP